MRNTIRVSDAMEHSVAERIELVEDLWNSIAQAPEAVELTDEQMKVLDERLAAYHADPEAGSPWEDVKRRVRGER